MGKRLREGVQLLLLVVSVLLGIAVVVAWCWRLAGLPVQWWTSYAVVLVASLLAWGLLEWIGRS